MCSIRPKRFVLQPHKPAKYYARIYFAINDKLNKINPVHCVFLTTVVTKLN